jgi:hypothetical protein
MEYGTVFNYSREIWRVLIANTRQRHYSLLKFLFISNKKEKKKKKKEKKI